MSEEPSAITYGRLIRWLREFIRNEVRAERGAQPAETIRIIPASPQGTRPLFHISDEDGGWMMDQPGTTGERRN